jgi:hypothetical protein
MNHNALHDDNMSEELNQQQKMKRYLLNCFLVENFE